MMGLLSELRSNLRRTRASIARLAARRHHNSYVAETKSFPAELQRSNLASARKSYLAMGLVNDFSYYRDFVAKLLALEDFAIVPLKSLFTPSGTARQLSLRYDVDVDPIAAIRIAQYNARFGFCGSVFLLHTAGYYGQMAGPGFSRNATLREWVQALIVAGCEIGLHIDPFGLYTQFRTDGAEGVETELAWLRSLGAKIEGTVAHNSFPTYGAENFEIFRERRIWRRSSLTTGDGIVLPLGVLSEAALDLTYEGNYARPVSSGPSPALDRWVSSTRPDSAQSPDWMKLYLAENPYCRFGPDVVVWLVRRGEWCLARPGDGVFLWKLTLDELFRNLASLPEGSRVSVVLHPIFFCGGVELHAS
ncbi:MAG: hypothetical protein HKP27_13115 [Myxococcales bacterium]|nr:hypothetical protein [Myxococcales bacterium]